MENYDDHSEALVVYIIALIFCLGNIFLAGAFFQKGFNWFISPMINNYYLSYGYAVGIGAFIEAIMDLNWPSESLPQDVSDNPKADYPLCVKIITRTISYAGGLLMMFIIHCIVK